MSTSTKPTTFQEMLDAYLAPPSTPNPEMVGITIVWVDDDLRLGALHIREKHGITKSEVNEVLTRLPPFVQAKRATQHPERTVFWGATQHDRWLVVVCEDWTEDGNRCLKPITAFEPDDGHSYWKRL